MISIDGVTKSCIWCRVIRRPTTVTVPLRLLNCKDLCGSCRYARHLRRKVEKYPVPSPFKRGKQ